MKAIYKMHNPLFKTINIMNIYQKKKNQYCQKVPKI